MSVGGVTMHLFYFTKTFCYSKRHEAKLVDTVFNKHLMNALQANQRTISLDPNFIILKYSSSHS